MSLNDIRNAADFVYQRAGFNIRHWPVDKIAVVKIHPVDFETIKPKDQQGELLIAGAWVQPCFDIEPNTMQFEMGTLQGDF